MSGTAVAFEKWEGLGNDFVLVEADPRTWSDERVRAVCDRRRGVGADGVLFVDRGAGDGGGSAGLPRMIVRNADGSRPEMCGNGIRCVAGYLASRAGEGRTAREGEGRTAREGEGLMAGRGDDPTARGAEVVGALLIATDAGPKKCETRGGNGSFEVAVAMGAATVGGTLAVEIEGRTHVFTRGDVGNPHAVTFEPYDEAAIEQVGPRVATSPPGGTNVEFCRLVRDEAGARIDVIVWERGVGRTQACGTGACAVAAAACAAGLASYGTPVRVRLPGGELSIVIEAGTSAANMRGPARRVFVGELETP